MPKLMMVDNPTKRKAKKKKSIKRKSKPKVKAKKKPTVKRSPRRQERKVMAKKKTKSKKSKSKAVARTRPRTKARKTRRRSGGTGIQKILKDSVMPAVIGGGGAVALDVALAMLPLPPAFKMGPGKLLVKGGAAIAGGMALSTMVDKKVGNAFLVGALTLLAADITKMMVGRAFPALSLGYYDGDGMDDGMNEYMSEYMSEASDDPGYMTQMYDDGDDDFIEAEYQRNEVDEF